MKKQLMEIEVEITLKTIIKVKVNKDEDAMEIASTQIQNKMDNNYKSFINSMDFDDIGMRII